MGHKDLKPRNIKAPLHLLPARALRAVASAIEDGAVKYAPWNWLEQKDDYREVYGAAMARHVCAFNDPTESDYAKDSGVHHIAHAVACGLILLTKLGIDYHRSNAAKTRPLGEVEALKDRTEDNWRPHSAMRVGADEPVTPTAAWRCGACYATLTNAMCRCPCGAPKPTKPFLADRDTVGPGDLPSALR